MSDDLHLRVEALQKEVEYWQGVAWRTETTEDLQKRLVVFTEENRRLNDDNCNLRRQVKALEAEVESWKGAARSARSVTRTYMRVGEILISEREGLEYQIDKLKEEIGDLKKEIGDTECALLGSPAQKKKRFGGGK